LKTIQRQNPDTVVLAGIEYEKFVKQMAQEERSLEGWLE
jgi:hypothetical protein